MSFVFAASDIIRKNLSALALLVIGNVCTAGLSGMLMVGGNGFGVSVIAEIVGPGIWLFAPLEVVSFCVAGGAAQCMSLAVARWAIGKRETGVLDACRHSALVIGGACIGLAVAAGVEAAVLLWGVR